MQEIPEQYHKFVANNSAGALVPLVYKFDAIQIAADLIQVFVETDMAANKLLHEYETMRHNMTEDEKSDLWERFSRANSISAVLRQLIEQNEVVKEYKPELYKAELVKEIFIDDVKNPDKLQSAIDKWIKNRTEDTYEGWTNDNG